MHCFLPPSKKMIWFVVSFPCLWHDVGALPEKKSMRGKTAERDKENEKTFVSSRSFFSFSLQNVFFSKKGEGDKNECACVRAPRSSR